MLYNDILNFLGQQNFALTETSDPEITVLRNTSDEGRTIFCVVMDNTKGRVWNSSQILSINSQLTTFRGTYNDVLFLVITDDTERDKVLSQIYQVRLWIIDSLNRELLVYEGQPEDFYGLRFGLSETAAGELYPDKSPRRRARGRNRRSYRANSIPYVTIVLIAINVMYFVILILNGSLSDSSYMLKMGANYGVYVFEKFQIWRLVTCMFMHFSVSHLIGNMFYLAIAGYNLEKEAGHLRFFLIYMLSGIGASLVSAGYYYLAGINTISAGASGAIYGLVGAMLYVTFRNRGRIRSPQLFLRIGIIIIFLFYSNFITEDGVDGAAHIGGFIFGLALSFIFLGGKKHERR